MLNRRIKSSLIPIVFLIMFGLLCSAYAAFQKEPHKIIVYYFHRTFRCPSCTLLEELTYQSVELRFFQEIKNGTIEIKAVNVDKKENEHFTNDYDLSVQSVVLSEINNGKEKRWKKLDQVWTLLHEEEKLIAYIQQEIRSYLKS